MSTGSCGAKTCRASSRTPEALACAGAPTAAEALSIVTGLQQIKGEIERGEFFWDREKEDVHMNIEARLTEICGPVGGKLHTGRSRNDQVATDLRLWTRRKADETLLCAGSTASREVLLDAAEREIDVADAGVHAPAARPAEPALASPDGLARAAAGATAGRLLDARARLNESPLGAGAVAGTGFPLDRAGVAPSSASTRRLRNSIDATGSRDFLMEVASALAILGVHLSRIGEEIVLWSTQEFGFIALSATHFRPARR